MPIIHFFHGDLNEEIYMSPPPGLKLDKPNQVCKLQKSLYGLKQASRPWYAKLSSTLKEKGYQHPKNDYFLFHRILINYVTYVVVYLDDIVVIGNNHEEVEQLKSFLDNKLMIKDLGLLNFFLGIEVLYFSSRVILTQRKFTYDMLK